MENHDTLSYRAFQRAGHRIPIRYAAAGTEHFFNATMVNSSDGGMYFESDTRIEPRADLLIHIAGAPDGEQSEYRAEVRWCREMKDCKPPCYGIGVRFVSNVCHQCGDIIAVRDIRRTPDHIRLCPSCNAQMESMKEGKIKECLEQYLLGNVI